MVNLFDYFFICFFFFNFIIFSFFNFFLNHRGLLSENYNFLKENHNKDIRVRFKEKMRPTSDFFFVLVIGN